MITLSIKELNEIARKESNITSGDFIKGFNYAIELIKQDETTSKLNSEIVNAKYILSQNGTC
jgi:hypothetical protein